eukprot:Seg804.2 transcript_id=Seg804.2/GoldUCD/mRNA.D3Y31 product="hypothetical protein" protein_id=Seg804.2/GoldUCD/D3Y31
MKSKRAKGYSTKKLDKGKKGEKSKSNAYEPWIAESAKARKMFNRLGLDGKTTEEQREILKQKYLPRILGFDLSLSEQSMSLLLQQDPVDFLEMFQSTKLLRSKIDLATRFSNSKGDGRILVMQNPAFPVWITITDFYTITRKFLPIQMFERHGTVVDFAWIMKTERCGSFRFRCNEYLAILYSSTEEVNRACINLVGKDFHGKKVVVKMDETPSNNTTNCILHKATEDERFFLKCILQRKIMYTYGETETVARSLADRIDKRCDNNSELLALLDSVTLLHEALSEAQFVSSLFEFSFEKLLGILFMVYMFYLLQGWREEWMPK